MDAPERLKYLAVNSILKMQFAASSGKLSAADKKVTAKRVSGLIAEVGYEEILSEWTK